MFTQKISRKISQNMQKTSLSITHSMRTGLTGISLFVLTALLVILLAACANPFASLSSTTGTNALGNTNLVTVLPLLQKSVQVTEQLTSFHVAMKGKGTIQTSGPLLPAFAHATPYSVRGAADVTIAGQAGKAQTTLKLSPAQGGALSFKDAARFLGQHLYVQVPSHQWYILDLASVVPFLSSQAIGLMPQPQVWLALLQHVTVRDEGIMALGTLHVHHITLSIDQAALGQLMSGLPQPAQHALANIQLIGGLSVGLSIDAASARVVQLEWKGGVRINVDGLLAAIGKASVLPQGNQARMVTCTFDVLLTFSRFNRPVPKVNVPPNATPITLP
jgi:hypothetical protein